MNRIAPLIVGLLLAVHGRAGEPPAAQPRTLDLKNIDVPDPNGAWSQNLRARRDAVNRADRKAWQTIQTKQDWEAFKAPRIEALRASLGEFPPPPKELATHIAKTIQGDGFKIANLIYETRPGFFVTANLYSPLKPSLKMPGILIITSHHNPKTQGELQDMGMTWARLGCLVLVPDQLGHGERRNHPFTDASTYPGAFKVGRQDYYFRYNEALQLHLIGDSLIGWMVWDTMRGVDLLLSRPGIDPGAIILLGSVAGGGDPAAVTAAIDPRITAVAPFNFGGPQPETKFPLPADAEARFNYLGGGSWESTRGLRLSAKEGFLPWVIVGSVAPRGLIYGHEFAWDSDKDPVWARFQKIYGFYGAADRLSSTHGRGAVTGKPPEATHCNNIGPMHRRQIYPTVKKWFDIAEPGTDYQQRQAGENLLCWTDEAKKTYKPRSLSEIAWQIGKNRVEVARKKRAGLGSAEAAAQLREDWARLLGHVEPSKNPPGYVAQNSSVEVGLRGDGLGLYGLMLPPNAKKGQKHPVIVAFAQGGIEAFEKERRGVCEAFVRSGMGVCLVELRGMRTKGARGRSSTGTSLSATEQMLGETVLGHQLRELRELLAYLRKHEGVDGKRLALWGDSLANVNPPDCLMEVPLDAAKLPELAEPGCALLALLGGLFEDDVRAVYARGGLVSFQSVLRSPFVYVPHDAIVPGALRVGDWTDIAAALAPRSVRLEGLVDGLNRKVPDEELAKVHAPARSAYQGAAGRFSLSAEPSSAESLARWFVAALKNN